MPERPDKKEIRQDLSLKSRILGGTAANLIRLLSCGYRWKVEDPDGILENLPDHPMIWTFWHNRIFVLPGAYRRYLKSRNGAVLTSASKDGEVLAAALAAFGVAAVRGSSSRRGASALLGLTDWIKNGYDVAITPDGPRGPRYKLAPGVIKLAQVTGAAILPVRVNYGSTWTFNSWDKFRFPKPFSKITLILEPLEFIDSELEGEAFESERVRIESILNPHNEID